MLFAQEVWSVVGGNDVDVSVDESFAECIAVVDCFDCRVALYSIAQPFIVGVGKPEVVHTHLGGYAFVGQWCCCIKQRQLAGSGEVQHIQTGAMTVGQFNCASRALVAGFGAAD